MLEKLLDKQLIFVTGKGGVGKSSVAASLGKSLANAGKKTLVVETDAFSVMQELLEVESQGSEIVPVDDNLWSANLEATDCFVLALQRFVPSERISRAIVDNKVARVFFKAAPSVNEFAILDRIFVLLQQVERGEAEYDHIVVDLPASGHAVTFLNVPRTLAGMIKVGPIAKRTGEMADVIEDPDKTGVVAVCLPEEMPVRETIELSQKIEDALGRGLTTVLVNMVHRSPVDESRREALQKAIAKIHETGGPAPSHYGDYDEPISRILAGNELALGWHDRDRKYIQILEEEISAPVLELPMVYATEGREIVVELAERLGRPETTVSETLAS
jgi:anion-transporting  ArsA/GET3 family ATPase